MWIELCRINDRIIRVKLLNGRKILNISAYAPIVAHTVCEKKL